MSTIRSILAASDFSAGAAAATHRAAQLAGQHAAVLQLVHVVSVRTLTDLREIYRDTIYTEQAILDDATRRLAALARDLRAITGSAPACSVLTGNVVDEILGAADRADLLVLGAHGSRSLADMLLGTTAERLVRRCRRPVLLSKLEQIAAYRCIVVAVDFSGHSIAALRFAQQIAPDADLLLFHAYGHAHVSALHPGDMHDPAIVQYHAQRQAHALSNMQKLWDEGATAAARVRMATGCGDARTIIAAKAAEIGADLLVLGQHGRSFAGERFLGGVTRHTLARAPCDVAVIPEQP